jgi:hypothetical protein
MPRATTAATRRRETAFGNHSHPVTTANAAAQRYFDQGLRLVYGFNHDEAIRAFREAARLDPDCAMAWWGIAFAAGPNYNLPKAVYREDLRRNPENGWALLGLSRSLRERNPGEAAATDARFREAWANADVRITGSRF